MPSWRPNCLRGSIYNEVPHYSITPKNTAELAYQGQEIHADRKGIFWIELEKKEGCGLGLTISGGVDKGQRSHVSNLRPGSIAHRCDALQVGDLIVSINDIRTANLRHEEITNLLKNAGTNVTLEVEYEIPESGPSGANVYSQVHDVVLEKEMSGFGMTLRGGVIVDRMTTHPITVVAIRQGGPVDRESSIKIGDRVLAINGFNVKDLTLTETISLFAQCDNSTTFTMSYDVAIMDAIENATGPILIDVDRPPGSSLGVILSKGVHEGKSCISVDSVQPMSMADRCGALHSCDKILSINGTSVEAMSVPEANQLLKSGPEDHIQLEIVPSTQLDHFTNRESFAKKAFAASFSSHTLPAISNSLSPYSNLPFNHHHRNKSSTIGGYGSSNERSSKHFVDNSVSVGTSQFGTLSMRKPNLWRNERRAASCMSIASSSTSVLSANNQVCHTETLEVILFADHKGLGLTLKGGVFATAPLSRPPVISFVEPRSAAEKSAVLQEGDRILAINGVETMDRSLEEVNQLLRESRPRCVLLVEFDVTESVTPSSGTYIVKLAKRAGDTGITVNATTCKQGIKDSLFISDVRRGGVAHRSGSIQAGDKLMAINDVRLDTCTSDDAMHLLELPDDIVKLKLRRDDPDEGNEGFIIYTVELQRFGGPLGITISGTEDPLDPIVISELTPHGLADRTGAIHVGDRLLAVSGDTTKNKPLSEAIRMLQSAGDIVTLKIARPDPTTEGSFLHINPFAHSHSSPITSNPIPSIDSAMESWNSSAHDIAGTSDSGHGPSLAVPHRTGAGTKSIQSSSDFEDDQHINNSFLNWDTDSQVCKIDTNKTKEADEDSDGSSTQMDDWVKTLEELDMESGSDMLKQIGLSLRERGVISTEKELISEPELPALPPRSRITIPKSSPQNKTSDDGVNKGPKSDPSLHQNISNRVGDSTSFPTISQPTSTSKRGPPPPTKPKPKIAAKPKFCQLGTITTQGSLQLHKVKLEKTKLAEDFGFSLSDGMYERGVYISAVRKGSVAEKSGLLALDRVLQVNRVKTREFDCSLTVPLIAESDTKVSLIVCRNLVLQGNDNKTESNSKGEVASSNGTDKRNGFS
ncbi:unnamed protein product [Lymnaea stagnalis]|uniref:PDZ domain-containing protein n=1 Tax=Lymnaea stagnalis TaxID=6523 RepID=A0AAV2H036_LYMST